MVKSLTYEQFLALFPDKPRHKAADGWLVICPAHNDREPSLLVTPADNPDFVADMKCMAGCTKEAVLTAMKLTRADMRRNGHNHKDTSPATMNRAKKKLGIKSEQEHEPGKKGADKWYFVMPDKEK